jgi:transforming growth factor-beta-induced protein
MICKISYGKNIIKILLAVKQLLSHAVILKADIYEFKETHIKMRKFFVTVVVTLLLLVMAVPAFTQSRDIVATANRDQNFSTFVSLVETAGLTQSLQGDGPLTVFAPTNQAFTNFLNSTGLTVDDLTSDPDLLTTILTFHVLANQPIIDANQNGVGQDELRAAYAGQPDNVLELTTLSGEELTLQFTAEDDIILNRQPISVNAANIIASNGVIHAINGVLLPPSLRNEAGVATIGSRATILDLLAEDANSFSTFLTALDDTGLSQTLQDTTQEFTVFAPTNAAMTAAQADLAQADANQVLSLHIIPGEFTVQDIANEIATRNVRILVLDTLNGGQITLQLDADGTLLLNGQGITATQTDRQVANGVVHFIPGVMFPSDGLTIGGLVARDSNFTILEEAVEVAGLTATLTNPDANFTVFAPTDDAFLNLLARTNLTKDELFADAELLTTILSFHVVEGAQPANTLIAAYAGSNDDVLEIPTVQGENLTMQVDSDDNILLNGRGITVSVQDIDTDNGIIHAVPAVLLPPSLLDDNRRPLIGERLTVVDFASNSSDFSILASLLEQQGLIDALSAEGPYTVFAPTNGAFQAAQSQLNTLDDAATTRVLQFHVLAGQYTLQDIQALYLADADGILELETLSGDILTLQIQPDGAIVMNGQGITPFLFDQRTTNGVIHVIPGVLLPANMQ